MPHEEAEADGDLRIVDESGEDYLYSTGYFALADLPQAVKESLLQGT
jgi:hypothetical protein